MQVFQSIENAECVLVNVICVIYVVKSKCGFIQLVVVVVVVFGWVFKS